MNDPIVTSWANGQFLAEVSGVVGPSSVRRRCLCTQSRSFPPSSGNHARDRTKNLPKRRDGVEKSSNNTRRHQLTVRSLLILEGKSCYGRQPYKSNMISYKRRIVIHQT